MRAILVVFILGLVFNSAMVLNPSVSLAQGTVRDPKPPTGGPRKQLATIIYTGLGGAVLGLSTLSFYGRPQDKLANIAIGFAVGVIIGTGVVTVGAATNPDEFYGPSETSLNHWRFEKPDSTLTPLRASPQEQPISASYAFQF